MNLFRALRRHWDFALIFIAYAFAVFFILAHHEPWRDEADTWLAARDLSPSALRDFTRHAGQPILWYALLMPLAKAGLPFAAQGLLNFALAVAASALFLWHAPFRKLFKVLFLFNYFFAFEYAVLARSYMLSCLLMFVIACLFAQRRTRPLAYCFVVAILANTNVHSCLLAIVLLVEFAWNMRRETNAREILGMLLAGTGILLCILYVFPSADGQILRPQPMAWTLDEVFANAFVPTRRIQDASLAVAGHFLSAASIVAAAVILMRQPKLFAGYILSVAFFYLLFAFGHYGDIRHSGLLQLCAIFYLWIAGQENPASVAHWTRTTAWTVISVALALSCWTTLRLYKLEYRQAYSASREMAEFIISHNLADRPIAAFSDPPAEAVLAHLPSRQFWYAGGQRFGSFMKWDRAHSLNRRLPLSKAMQRIETFAALDTNVLVLLNMKMPINNSAGYTLLHATTSIVFSAVDEQYWLYEPEN